MSIHNTIFNNLPKELIDMIYEFNPDHRSQLNNVLDELEVKIPEYGTYICHTCDYEIEKEDIIESICLGYQGVYCSEYCRWDSEYDIRKELKRNIRRYEQPAQNIMVRH